MGLPIFVRIAVFALMSLVTWPAAAITDGYAEHDGQARAILDGVSWESPEVVEVVLSDDAYSPDEIVLPLGKPVILRLRNEGSVAHDMVGGSVFQAVLVKSIATASGRVVTPYIQSVYVRARQSTEIWLLPMRAGEFSFFCSIDGHRENGMEGRVRIR